MSSDEVIMLRGLVPGIGRPAFARLGFIEWGDETITPGPVCDESNDWCGALGPDDSGGGTGQPPPGFVGPGAVPVVVEAWDGDATPPRYQLQYGDTLAGLAATYLGDGTRWKEIWAVQSPNFRNTRSPDKLYASEWINMPEEALANLKRWLSKGEPPGTTPGQIAKTEKADRLRGPSGKTLALYAAGGLAALGLVWWAAS